MAAHTPTDPWHFTVATFQQRRRETWKAIRIWIAIQALAILTLAIVAWPKLAHATSSAELLEPLRYNLLPSDTTPWHLDLTFGAVSAIVAATVAIVMAVQRHYRCPKCETVPMGTSTTFGPWSHARLWGVEFNPSICQQCRARLR